MKTAIVYYSQHHGNTKKLIDVIAAKYEVTLIDVSEKNEDDSVADLSEYDLIGFASGIYFSKFANQVVDFAKKNSSLEGKKVFFLYTYGNNAPSYTKDIASVVSEKKAEVVGKYGCFGFDTYGPFKLIGGLKKGHPDESEIAGAIEFYESLL